MCVYLYYELEPPLYQRRPRNCFVGSLRWRNDGTTAPTDQSNRSIDRRCVAARDSKYCTVGLHSSRPPRAGGRRRRRVVDWRNCRLICPVMPTRVRREWTAVKGELSHHRCSAAGGQLGRYVSKSNFTWYWPFSGIL